MGNLSDILRMAQDEKRAYCKGQSCFECELDATWCAVRRAAWRAIVNEELMDSEYDECLRMEYRNEYDDSKKCLKDILKRMREL